jgi:aryl-alcohol dehydrogenase-like predicted oxidoreductase
MKYTRFGNTGMEVSRLCLGGMMFSRKMEFDTSRRAIDEALDRGINFIDTAESYGDSEDFIGRAIDGRRDRIYLATKVYTKRARDGRVGRNSRVNLIYSLERSLKLLRTDHVDLYQLHHPDADSPIEETLSTLDALVRAGKIRYVGVCNHYAWQMAYMIGAANAFKWEPLVSIQARYNILDRPIEVETVPMCRKFNLALMAYAPLCGGMLTGKYKRNHPQQVQGTRAADDKKLQALLRNDAAFDVIDRLNDIARRNDLALNQLAILWLMSKPFVTTPILGGSTPEQFRPLYDISDRELSPADVKQIDEISAGFIHRRFENQPVKEGPALAEQW